MTVVEYEARFTQFSHFALDLIANKERKAFCFQDGLNPFMKDRFSLLKLETYSEVVDNALLAKRSSKELQQSKEQQHNK